MLENRVEGAKRRQGSMAVRRVLAGTRFWMLEFWDMSLIGIVV